LAEEKTLASRLVFQGRAFNMRVHDVINAGGERTTREIVEHPECIAAIPVDQNGDIWLVKQFRKAVEKDLLEIPAGGIDPGEDPDSAVRRELQEEIGCRPGRIQKLTGFYSSPGFCTEFLYLYLAADLTPSRLVAEDTAGIKVVKIKPGEIKSLIAAGTICDAKSIAGLLYYLEFLLPK
jgi:ADP-ribose pyrophosphatase